MPKSTAKILLELEAAGTEWSRNKQFDLFSRDGPRQARKLRRLLDTFIAEVRRCGGDGRSCVSLHRVEGERPNVLRVHVPQTGGTMTLRLDDEELAILLRSADVRAAIDGRSGR